MPMIGFLPIPAGEDPLAGFPSDGLVALYKCDERTGDKLYDATGTLGPIVLNTGVALDTTNSANKCYINDMTFAGLIDDEPADFVFGFSGVSPELVSASTIHELISGNLQSHAPVRVFLTEASGFAATNRFSVTVRVLTNETAFYSLAISTTNFIGIPPSTPFQLCIRHYGTGVVPYAVFSYRTGCDGEWIDVKVASAVASGDYTLNDGGMTTYTALMRGTATAPYLGKPQKLFLAQGQIDLDAVKGLFAPTTEAAVQALLGTKARYWSFEKGSGTTCNEYITGTTPTITTAGTVTWANGVAGIEQTALRQGFIDGPAGVRIGGESGFAPGVGYGTTADSTLPILSSTDGWTVIATMRTSNRIPATDQFLFSVYGPNLDGSYSTDPTLQSGVHLVLDDAGLIRGVFKNITKGTGDAGTQQAAGVTADSPSNGLLGTYAIVCSSAGGVTTRRILSGETSVTTEATGTSVDHIYTRATRVAIGNASFGADLVLGFGAIYNRPLTDAEIIRCHNMALSRMTGAQSYVLAAATAGNGTSRYPYGALLSAGRTAQDYQTINIGAGSYTRLDTTVSGAMTTGADFITLQGAGIATTTITGGTLGTQAPIRVESGSWVISDMKLDGADDGAAPGDGHGANNCFTTGTSATVASTIFNRVHFYNARAAGQTGTGLVSRALHVELNDCEASSNGEHGVYLRIASETEGNHRAVIRGLYCHDNAEDGLKFAADTTGPDMATQTTWRNCIIDGVKVDGGKNQLWLAGVKDSVVTNALLLNKEDTGLDTGALYLGYPIGGGTTANEDGCENVIIANVTIYNASGAGVYDARSINTTLQNVICSQGDDDLVRGDDGTAVLTYCAGDSDSNKIDSGTGNLVDATIAFTNAAGGDYTLTEASDGYGDGVNLTGLSNEADVMFDGTTQRPSTGAWNMGAY